MILAEEHLPAVNLRDDRELMRQIESGNALAFEELYDRYCARAYRIARSVCRDSGRAEEAVQEAFTSIWRNRGTYMPQPATVAAWLLSSVRYRAIDATRRHRTHADRAQEQVINLRRSPDEMAEGPVLRDDDARLHELLERLPDSQQEVITLAFYGQLTHVEIAAQLRLPAGTVKGRMRSGLRTLRGRIEQDAA